MARCAAATASPYMNMSLYNKLRLQYDEASESSKEGNLSMQIYSLHTAYLSSFVPFFLSSKSPSSLFTFCTI